MTRTNIWYYSKAGCESVLDRDSDSAIVRPAGRGVVVAAGMLVDGGGGPGGGMQGLGDHLAGGSGSASGQRGRVVLPAVGMTRAGDPHTVAELGVRRFQ